MKKSRFLSLVLAVVIAVGILSGCSDESKSSTVVSKEPSSSTDSPKESKLDWQPLKGEPVELSIFLNPNPFGDIKSQGFASLQDIPYVKQLEEKTNVKLKVVNDLGDPDAQISLLLASDQLPDIFDGGRIAALAPDKLFAEKTIIDLTDLLPKFAPNYWNALKNIPDADKMAKDDNGRYLAFGYLRDTWPATTGGPVIRKDLLDKLGLPIPETVDEWVTTLKEFKDKLGIQSPYAGKSYDFLTNAYGVKLPTGGNPSWVYYLNPTTKKIVYGSLETGAKELITLYAQLKKDGLLVGEEPIDKESIGSKGVGLSFLGSANEKKNEETGGNWNWVPTSYPVLNKGDAPKWYTDAYLCDFSCQAIITTACKNVEAAVNFLDYHYFEKGSLYDNFGIEGESFDFVNGKPVLQPWVFENNEKWRTMGTTVATHAGRHYPGFADQYYYTDKAKDARSIWPKKGDIVRSMPDLLLTADEAKLVDEKRAIIDEYSGKTVQDMIDGKVPMEQYDAYVAELKKKGIQEVLAAYQAAYDRFLAR